MNKTLSLAAVLATATLALTACGGTSSPTAESSTGGSSTSSSPASTRHNQQDVTFATDMVPHHAQAIAMAKMAATNARSAQVKKLAIAVEAAQGPEIKKMTGWLKAWGAQAPSTSMNGMNGMGGSDDMPGMMSGAMMTKLHRSTGDRFDQMWLRSMIGHHQGAVKMSYTEIAEGKSSDAIALAKAIKSAQTAEIATMRSLLGS